MLTELFHVQYQRYCGSRPIIVGYTAKTYLLHTRLNNNPFLLLNMTNVVYGTLDRRDFENVINHWSRQAAIVIVWRSELRENFDISFLLLMKRFLQPGPLQS